MAELPEIERRLSDLQGSCIGGKIDRVEVLERDVLPGMTPTELNGELANTTLRGLKRRGSYLYLETNRDSTLVMDQSHDGEVHCQLSYEPQPRFTRLVIHFDDGHDLDFISQDLQDKLFFYPTTDSRRIAQFERLGPDPWEMDFKEFHRRLGSHCLPIREALMLREEISGIGPDYADEICFQARIRPDRSTSDLLKGEWENLFEKMLFVYRRAHEVGGDPNKLGEHFITPRRGTDQGCPLCGGGMAVAHFGTDRSYYCPHCQNGPNKEDRFRKFA